MMVCKSGELLKKSCRDNEWCSSQGECKAQCERVDTNDGTITNSILASKNASTPLLLNVEKGLNGKFLAIFVIIASILFFIILGACWYYRDRIKRCFNKNSVGDSQAMEIYLRRVALPSTPNMSSIRLITLNQLIIDNKKLGEGEFGAVYAAKLMFEENSDKKFPAAVKVINPTANLRHNIEFAMEYLAKNKIVHRDLATRNVLMKRYQHVEVADFGLSSLLEGNIRSPQKLPFRWVPMECLQDLSASLYCEATDVWSFGVTCWEILTFAKLPYENLHFTPKAVLQTLYKYLSDGNRLEKPGNCGLEFYQLLIMCWSQHQPSRPKFSMLKEILENYKTNPFAYVSDIRHNPTLLETPTESGEAQVKLISQMLGKDDYLYEDYLIQPDKNEQEFLNNVGNYYIENKRLKRSNSDSTVCMDTKEYLLKKKKIEADFRKLKLKRSNSYLEVVTAYQNGGC
uniref:Protein kinase domain-containing protein n=1 Tax=Acrobeloides nanus TaxID=290746 RepID=A0A914CJW7_9BILA